eukprot:8184823-Pyramimonas_sp.AAC.1
MKRPREKPTTGRWKVQFFNIGVKASVLNKVPIDKQTNDIDKGGSSSDASDEEQALKERAEEGPDGD